MLDSRQINLNSEVELDRTSLSAGLESGLGSGSGSGYERRIQLRRSWDLPVQDAVEQGNSRLQSAPTFRLGLHCLQEPRPCHDPRCQVVEIRIGFLTREERRSYLFSP